MNINNKIISAIFFLNSFVLFSSDFLSRDAMAGLPAENIVVSDEPVVKIERATVFQGPGNSDVLVLLVNAANVDMEKAIRIDDVRSGRVWRPNWNGDPDGPDAVAFCRNSSKERDEILLAVRSSGLSNGNFKVTIEMKGQAYESAYHVPGKATGFFDLEMFPENGGTLPAQAQSPEGAVTVDRAYVSNQGGIRYTVFVLLIRNEAYEKTFSVIDHQSQEIWNPEYKLNIFLRTPAIITCPGKAPDGRDIFYLVIRDQRPLPRQYEVRVSMRGAVYQTSGIRLALPGCEHQLSTMRQ